MGAVEIPVGLKELLQGYTVEVLRRRPPDLVEFAVQHFTQVLEGQRKNPKAKRPSARLARKGVTFETKANKPDKDEEEEEEEETESECCRIFCVCLRLLNDLREVKTTRSGESISRMKFALTNRVKNPCEGTKLGPKSKRLTMPIE